ncbi:uncharacterized protein UV8b_07422 [Ustilaginoidea virens]|uniref:Uncharacterized protein n=1 Tax=Ustilaginoidea virens TaxID=1159556 RepID=A0A063BXH4_USTVR|nr:uncharacterized protein UV8b_07422 [Ustilaginoidea virens]QUC23181.1 hypothetical protein UV8b_07422 [Ustilaginoidea virens]GAO17748.1 hypothetical protein UVI_02033500 [Ustilaginoidea virens]
MSLNPFLLAADNDASLAPLLRENPSLASAQDEHGYSLIHAAASYNHLDLLRMLVLELNVDVNLKDEDDETALFVVETMEAAKVLVEELGVDVHYRGASGMTAAEKIASEGDFPYIAAYLASIEPNKTGKLSDAMAAETIPDRLSTPPPGIRLKIGMIDSTEDIPVEVDQEFRRRIEDLAQRDDFNDPSGQADLRRLVADAVLKQRLSD